MQTTATDVTTSRKQYMHDDDEAAAGLPSLPLPESSQGPVLPVTPGGEN